MLAPFVKQPAEEQYLIGLLSVIDAILQVPMAEIIGRLPLRAEAAAALLGEDNPAAAVLRLSKSWEQGEWCRCANRAESLGLSEPELTGYYLSSTEWAGEAVRSAGE